MQEKIGKMAARYPMMIGMGFAIVIAAFVIGYFNSQTAASYFASSKVVRETTLMAQRASFESINMWLSPLKFLGLGLILSGIVMALKVIIDRLLGTGRQVLTRLPAGQNPKLPSPPWYGLAMPLVMMMGELILIITLIIGIRLGAISRSIFINPIPVIDQAGAGSALLSGLQTIHMVEGWLVPLKFLGIGTLFLAITMGLATILFILTAQTSLLKRILTPA